MAKPLRNIVEKVQTDPAPKAPKEGQFSGKRSTTEAPPSIDKDNFYNWEGGEDGVKFIKKHQTSRRNYPYDADAAFTSGKVKQVDMTKHGYKKPADAKVYESKGMKCESCGKMYEGEACGCGSSSDNNKKGKKLLLGGKKLQEVLTKKTPVSKVISDFVHSDDPKFAGKSKKERMKMALGAYYKKQNEEVEGVEEAMRPGFDWEKAAKDTQRRQAAGYERSGPYSWRKKKEEKPEAKPPVKEEVEPSDRTEDTLAGRVKSKQKDDVSPSAHFKPTKVRFHAGPKNEDYQTPHVEVKKITDESPATVVKTQKPEPRSAEDLKAKEGRGKQGMKEDIDPALLEALGLKHKPNKAPLSRCVCLCKPGRFFIDLG